MRLAQAAADEPHAGLFNDLIMGSGFTDRVQRRGSNQERRMSWHRAPRAEPALHPASSDLVGHENAKRGHDVGPVQPLAIPTVLLTSEESASRQPSPRRAPTAQPNLHFINGAQDGLELFRHLAPGRRQRDRRVMTILAGNGGFKAHPRLYGLTHEAVRSGLVHRVGRGVEQFFSAGDPAERHRQARIQSNPRPIVNILAAMEPCEAEVFERAQAL